MLAIIGSFSFLLAQAPVQDKAELEKERQKLQTEINEMQNQYDNVKGQTKKSVAQLNILNRKIRLQESYVRNIDKELRMIDDDIYLSNVEIYRLQKQLDTLKSQYARSVVYAYKNRSTYDYLNFIFSATDFNDAIKRISYLKSYRSYREQQVGNIIETRKQLALRKEQQFAKKDEQRKALENQTRQMKSLDEQKREKDEVVSKLKSQEKDLQKQLAAKRRRDNELKNSMMAIVNREIAKAADEAKKNAKAIKNTETNSSTNSTTPNITPVKVTRPGDYLNLNASDVRLNKEFGNNRGRLPWPVDNGYVSGHFGFYTIEGTSIRGENPGITISTPSAGVPVKSVFDGEVAGIFNSGDEMGVTIRHGKYFTTYSNLSSVSVKKGDEIKTGETLGKLGVDEDAGGGRLDFLLMIEKKNVNPEQWLIRR